MKLKHWIVAISTTIALCQGAQANVVNSDDVAGLRTFQDTGTGRIWLDMDNFFDESATFGTTGNAMIAAAQAAGFIFATKSDVEQLLNTLPLNGGQWATYANVTGYGHPRQIIFGMYDDTTGDPFGIAWAWSDDSSWSYADDLTSANAVQNEGANGSVDMGIWAYKLAATNDVPEPGMLALLGLGFLGLCVARRKRA